MGHSVQLWLPHDLISMACTVWRSFIFLRQIEIERGKIGQEEGEVFPFAAVGHLEASCQAGCKREVSLPPPFPPLCDYHAHSAFRSTFPASLQSSRLCGLAVQPDAA